MAGEASTSACSRVAQPRFQVFARASFRRRAIRSASQRAASVAIRLVRVWRCGVDLDERAAVDAAFLRAAALRAAAVVDHLRPAQQRAAIVPAAEGPVVDAADLQGGRVDVAMGHGDRVQAGRIGREIGRPQRAVAGRGSCRPAGQGSAVALDGHFLDPARVERRGRFAAA